MKEFWLDVETSGTDPSQHGIIGIAAHIYVDGKHAAELVQDVGLHPIDKIDKRALEVNSYTGVRIAKAPTWRETYKAVIDMMSKHVDHYDKRDKFHLFAYNATFDDSFLREFFAKCGDQYYGSWFWWPPIDVAVLAALLLMEQRPTLPNFQLATVCRAFGLEWDDDRAHDAGYDVAMTRMLYQSFAGNATGLIQPEGDR